MSGWKHKRRCKTCKTNFYLTWRRDTRFYINSIPRKLSKTYDKCTDCMQCKNYSDYKVIENNSKLAIFFKEPEKKAFIMIKGQKEYDSLLSLLPEDILKHYILPKLES